MEGREAIVGKILSDAEEKAAAIRADASARAETLAQDARRAAEESLAAGRRALETQSAEIVARRETVAALDVRKALLAAKRSVIDEVFAGALASARAFGKAKYCSVLEALLERYAETGDEVYLAADAPVGEKELVSCKAFAAKKLRFAGRMGLSGGLRLENDVCVKDLSFGALLEAERGELEREIAAAVFPAEK